jgi:hypothetical protein
MLHELFVNVFWVCAIIVMLAATLVVLRKTYLYYHAHSRHQLDSAEDAAMLMKLSDSITSAPECAIVGQKDWSGQEKQPPSIPKTTKNFEEPQPETSLIECGSCGKEIMSEPIEIKRLRGEKAFISVYGCEHCGTMSSLTTDL